MEEGRKEDEKKKKDSFQRFQIISERNFKWTKHGEDGMEK